MAPAPAADLEQDDAVEQNTETQPLLQEPVQQQQHPTTQQTPAASADKSASRSNLQPGSPAKAAGSQLLRQAAALLSKQSSGNARAKSQELGQCRWVPATHCCASVCMLLMHQCSSSAGLYLGRPVAVGAAAYNATHTATYTVLAGFAWRRMPCQTWRPPAAAPAHSATHTRSASRSGSMRSTTPPARSATSHTRVRGRAGAAGIACGVLLVVVAQLKCVQGTPWCQVPGAACRLLVLTVLAVLPQAVLPQTHENTPLKRAAAAAV
jgi:hypothetical protein